MIRAGISDHREIDGGNWTAKAGIRHMAGRTGHVPKWRHIQIVIQEAAEYPLGCVAIALNGRGVTCYSQWPQLLQLQEILLENAANSR